MVNFVYFDLGGVVEIDISPTDRWTKMKRDIGITSDKDVKFEKFWKKYEPELSVGKDQDSLVPLLRKEFGLHLPHGYSMLNDFVDRFEVNKSIWPIINEIKKNSKIGILTNMYPGMLDAIKKRNILPSVDWDIIIDSSVVKVAKPDAKIYALAEEKSHTKGTNILFVDNNQKNINAADNFGWLTFLYNPSIPVTSSNELLNFFRSHLSM